MAMHADISTPLGISVASAATFVSNMGFHFFVFGMDSSGFFAFRFFLAPAIVILPFLIPAVTVLSRRMKEFAPAVIIRSGATYRWLIGIMLLLAPLTSVAMTGIDAMGYWLLGVIYFMPIALVISAVLGIVTMLIVVRAIRRRKTAALTE